MSARRVAPMKRPASAGPIKYVSCHAVVFQVTARASSSLGTSLGNRAPRAGPEKAWATPLRKRHA
ncbi:hypothetical protein D3C86_1913690 [compost metagenome]